MFKLLCTVFVLSLATLAHAAPAQPVKRSESGLCHAPGTRYYNQTKKFTPFATVEACLGGAGAPVRRSPSAGAAAPVAPSVAPSDFSSDDSYNRSRDFGRWADDDGDCVNTRHEILAALSTARVIMSADGCSVERGRWIDPYTNQIFLDPADLDIDHVVPLAWAWANGASAWDKSRRVAFANDPVNLLAVDASANRSKGALGPEQWLPPNQSYRCAYVLRFQRIAMTYGIFSGDAEAQILAVRALVC